MSTRVCWLARNLHISFGGQCSSKHVGDQGLGPAHIYTHVRCVYVYIRTCGVRVCVRV